ncbi:hypothetical protein DFR60_11741 [Hungatella effluvii]|uniref:Uncharacterized protein n=1 Tax=Hungatella effluvii TaxID=1096246 RepID=A0A2V3XZF8_9FIRM|nr:hypothetical protein [Hungatella effluvii]PXX48457.1 hypothetical protein DFR60_11741 [Hungatella effluvii]
MEEIAYQNKDITSKLMAETLKGRSLAAFGLPELKIVDILPTNLPVIESNELRLDNLFLLSDGSLAIIDYESSFSRENFVKYLNYIARVIRRFAIRRELKDLKQLKMVVIYTADVERAEERYDLGGLILVVESAYLIHLDGSQIYHRLKNKIDAGEKLTEEELMELMILPLTVKGKKRKQETIEKAVNLGKRLPDREGQLKVIAGILTFTDKVIDRAYAKKLEEEMQMTLVGQMLMDEGYQRGMEKGIQVFIQDNVSENVPKQRIIQKLQANFSLMEEEAINYYTIFSKQTPN